MSSPYFPPAYFAYVIFGPSPSPGSGTEPPEATWLKNVMSNVGSSLATLYETTDARILADIDEAGGIPISNRTVILVAPKSIRTHATEGASNPKTIATMTSEIRIRFPISGTDVVAQVLRAVSRSIHLLSANSFGGSCVASRSRILSHSQNRVADNVYQISIVLETCSIV